MTKAIVYYLPQFHEIPENNQWWGEGFTEWTNVRQARPLFPGHNQPVEPLDDNYYDLLDKATVDWQSRLAREHGIYAFDYYHYWFRGKKLLEKPAENLLAWTDIDQRFMFMWANHSWTRSWTGGREILVPMDYGDRVDWLDHAEYLVPFFLDERYVTCEGRPMFQIYTPRAVPFLDQMIEAWNEVLRAHGVADVYVVANLDYRGIKDGLSEHRIDAVNVMEHTAAMQYLEDQRATPIGSMKRYVAAATAPLRQAVRSRLLPNRNRQVDVYSYDRNVEASLDLMRSLPAGRKTYFGVCTGWDNTPRYGHNGYVVGGATPEKFERYLRMATELSQERSQEYLFLSCWNEWAEGMILEPTKRDGHAYLQAAKRVLG